LGGAFCSSCVDSSTKERRDDERHGSNWEPHAIKIETKMALKYWLVGCDLGWVVEYLMKQRWGALKIVLFILARYLSSNGSPTTNLPSTPSIRYNIVAVNNKNKTECWRQSIHCQEWPAVDDWRLEKNLYCLW
jgi:hypothetical protein